MIEFFSVIPDIDLPSQGGLPVYDVALRLGVAMILGMAVGFERAYNEHSAGMRTYAVVSMASALMMIVSIYGLPEIEEGRLDPGRIAAQVVSGIGFLGAGLIFMRRNVVHGLTTAASLWAVAGVGLAVGGGLLITGTISTLLLLLISGGMVPVKKRLFPDDHREHRIRLYLDDADGIIDHIQELAESSPGFTVSSLDFESSADKKKSVLEIRMKVKETDDAIALVRAMEQLPGVARIGWHFGLE